MLAVPSLIFEYLMAIILVAVLLVRYHYCYLFVRILGVLYIHIYNMGEKSVRGGESSQESQELVCAAGTNPLELCERKG